MYITSPKINCLTYLPTVSRFMRLAVTGDDVTLVGTKPGRLGEEFSSECSLTGAWDDGWFYFNTFRGSGQSAVKVLLLVHFHLKEQQIWNMIIKKGMIKSYDYKPTVHFKFHCRYKMIVMRQLISSLWLFRTKQLMLHARRTAKYNVSADTESSSTHLSNLQITILA